MKGFFIDVANGLLEPKHVKAMGPSIWEFMWVIDHITTVDEHGIGWVLGGKPIKLDEIANSLGIHEVTVSEHLTRLEDAGYIFKVHAPYGIIITVAKAKRRFSEKAKARVSQMAKPPSRLAKPNKTVTIDITTTTPDVYTPEFETFWKTYPRRIGKGAAWKAWARIKARNDEQILKAVVLQSRQEQWRRDGGQYIPYPATWLNQRRWEDEVQVKSSF